ncbi:hypothetical protein D3C78_1286480 [compost metagenome]
MVRRLQHRQLLVFKEPAHGQLQERTRGDVIAVEDGNKITASMLERMVDIARFGVFMGRPGDVLHPDLCGKGFKLWAVTVVENVDIDFIFWPVDAQRRIDGGFHHAQIFVVGRHHQIDGRPGAAVDRHRHRLAVQRPHGLEVAQHQHYPGIGFRRQQQQAAGQAERIVPVQR